MSTVWRPRPQIRPISIGLIRREDALLVMAVADDGGTIKGWRPPGGAIEFGERAADALRREFLEEFDEGIAEPRLITVMENLYTHHDVPGHEIVFVFQTAFAKAEAYQRDIFRFRDGPAENVAHWVEWLGSAAAKIKSFRWG